MFPFHKKVDLILGPLPLDLQIILDVPEFIPQFHKIDSQIHYIAEIIHKINDHLFDQRKFIFFISIDHIQRVQDKMRPDLLADVFQIDFLLFQPGFIQIVFQFIDLIHHLIQTVAQQIKFVRGPGISLFQTVFHLSVSEAFHGFLQLENGL